MKKILFLSAFLVVAFFSFMQPNPAQAYGEASQYCPHSGGAGAKYCGQSWCDGPYNCTYHSWNCTGTYGNICSPTPPSAYSHPYSNSCSGSRGSTYCSSKRPYACYTSTYTCSQSTTGAYSTLLGCQTACVAPPVTKYACNTSTYACSVSATGTYSTQSACNTACVAPTCTYTYSAWSTCSASGIQTRTVISSSPTGCTGTPDTSQSCTPPVTKYACNTSTYNCSVSATGNYTTSADCEAACVAPPTKYACNTSTYNCSVSAAGNYTTSADCEAACVAPPTKYNCNTSTYTCSVSATGSYTDKTACEASCNPPATKYNCNTSTYTCSVSATGSYTDKTACEASCNPPPTLPPSSTLPSCPSSLFSAFAPAGVPTGGICILKKIIGIFLNVLIVTAIILAILFLIWGGIDWIMSGGDKQKLQSARHKLTFAIIGLVVVFVSFLILNFIHKFFGIT